MKLENLSNLELNEKIKDLAGQERKLLQDVLMHIAEVDRRKLYLAMSFPSLFDYLTSEIGYSTGAAQRRIDGARLLERIPEISVQIESGAINLSQISKVQRICRQIKKQSGEGVKISQQKEVLKKIENQGALQTDLILAQEFNIKIEAFDRQRIQRDESVLTEMTFSKEEMALVQRAKELLSNKTGGGLKDTVVEMAKQVIKKHTPVYARSREISPSRISESTATVAVKTVTPRLKREILFRDRCCQFKNPQTGRVCGARLFLESDHVTPRFAGGVHTPENLRVLCSAHNKFRYKQGAGLVKMEAGWR